MNSKFKISIPKPCHENWNTMTPREKGRFCNSCAKTVLDFTKKSTEEIKDYLVENKNQRVCGHFYKKQLDTITIEIPQTTFQQQLSFQKLFVLALLFVMGTTLFSCQYTDGKKQKIENVIIIDSLEIIEEGVGLIYPSKTQKDSIIEIITTGETIIMGGIPAPPLPPLVIDGNIDITEAGKVEAEEDILMGFVVIEETPRFKEAKNFSKKEAKKHFTKGITKFVQKHFNKELQSNLGLRKGKHKMYAQFTIDEKGNSINVRVRAPHKTLEKEALRLIEKLPQFIPGKQAGKIVKTKYTLPITFVVE